MNNEKIKRLASLYLNISIDELNNRIESNSIRGILDWNKYGYQEYDKNTEANIYGLVGFCDDDRIDSLTYPIRNERGKRILDFGGGIGALSIELSRRNFVTYYDLPSKTQEFAKFLAKHHDSNIKFISKEELESPEQFDIIIATDVLEHIKKPMDVVKLLTNKLVTGGLFLTTGLDFSIGENMPMHLPENYHYRSEYDAYMREKYKVVFFDAQIKEHIYLFVKR